jgi:hypothetical protein
VPHFDQRSAECTVLTFKEGLLSAVAHDLMIRVTRFDVDIDDASLAVTARFDATSLQVATAMHAGAPQPSALGESDKRKIEENILSDVLRARDYPEVRFRSTEVTRSGEGYRVAGELSLHGKTRTITFDARPDGERLSAEITLHQPDFGIKPYSAMLGTLKIKPDVIVRISLPRASLPAR